MIAWGRCHICYVTDTSTECAKIAWQGSVAVMDTPDIIARVKDAIGATGLSMSAFARQAGLDPNKLSKSLSGVRRLTSLELAQVGDAAHVTVDWLLNGRQRAEPSLAARRAGGTADDAHTVAQIARRFADADDILTMLRGASRTQVQPPAPQSRSQADQGIELADWASNQVNSSPEVNFDDLPSLLEAVFGVDTAIMELPAGYSGLSWHADGFRLAIASPERTPGRQRFTLAHELGHLLANDQDDLHIDYRPGGSYGQNRGPLEVRANYFAAAFLAPKERICELMGTATEVGDDLFPQLVSALSMSPEPLLIRLDRLGLTAPSLDRTRWAKSTGAACAQLAGAGDRLAALAGSSFKVRLPGRLANEMLEAYASGEIGIRPLANFLGIEVSQALDIFETPDVRLDANGELVA